MSLAGRGAHRVGKKVLSELSLDHEPSNRVDGCLHVCGNRPCGTGIRHVCHDIVVQPKRENTAGECRVLYGTCNQKERTRKIDYDAAECLRGDDVILVGVRSDDPDISCFLHCLKDAKACSVCVLENHVGTA